jgi:putative transposase
MMEEGNEVSIVALCRWFGVPRSSFYYRPKARPARPCNPERVGLVRQIIDANPLYGLRRIVAVARRRSPEPVNRKAIHRIVKDNGWQLRQMPRGKRPRAAGWRSIAERPNQRWAVDATHVFCGRDGWCHLTAIIDCCDRTIVGWRLSKTGVAKVAAAALEDALRERKIAETGSGLVLRSDNGLVFGAKPFVAVVNRWNLEQEYIVPYTPEQNGMIERFFGSLKAECVWLHRFENRDQAFRVIANWIDHYHDERPHQALDYLTPTEYRAKLAA